MKHSDTDLIAGTRLEALQAALDIAGEGDVLVVCRSDYPGCSEDDRENCIFCARIDWRPGLTAAKLISLSEAS